MKKIYGFCKYFWWSKDNIEIEEFEVVKETEKQYKTNRNCGFLSTINKRTMENSDFKFYETREEAVKGLIEYCERSIEKCENQINYEKDKISKYQKIIKANTK